MKILYDEKLDQSLLFGIHH